MNDTPPPRKQEGPLYEPGNGRKLTKLQTALLGKLTSQPQTAKQLADVLGRPASGVGMALMILVREGHAQLINVQRALLSRPGKNATPTWAAYYIKAQQAPFSFAAPFTKEERRALLRERLDSINTELDKLGLVVQNAKGNYLEVVRVRNTEDSLGESAVMTLLRHVKA